MICCPIPLLFVLRPLATGLARSDAFIIMCICAGVVMRRGRLPRVLCHLKLLLPVLADLAHSTTTATALTAHVTTIR